MSDQPPPFSPWKAFTKKSLLWVGLPIALLVGLLYSFYLSQTRTQRYIQGTADRWNAIHEQSPGMDRVRQRVEDARQRALERERGKAP